MCALLFAVNIALAALFIVIQTPEAAIAYSVAAGVALVCLLTQHRLLHDASLICDNRIFSVPSAIITSSNSTNEKTREETVVSTFGLLLGNKVYRWGRDGVGGTRLREIKLGRKRVWLTFGTKNSMQRVELLHGIANRQDVLEITQRLWRETGIQADISDWSSVNGNPSTLNPR